MEDDLACLEIGEGVRLTGIPVEEYDYRAAGIPRRSGRRRT